jgi:hypothetical protein
MTAGEPDLDLGTTATINTDDGTVMVDGRPVAVNHATIAQASAPTIQVFIVHSLTTVDVTITGNNALAIVGTGALTIGGVFTASATHNVHVPGAGSFTDGLCKGGEGVLMLDRGLAGGSGGGGFGRTGGFGGNAVASPFTANGGAAGITTGDPTLVPLRGGCDGGGINANGTIIKGGGGGGAIQLVSRTKITVSGTVAANGASFVTGGSGGGILLEAPLVEVRGSVVANGGSGAGVCRVFDLIPGEDGRLDAKPATGGATSACGTPTGADGGNGGAGSMDAHGGASNVPGGFGGHGGGGVGRIRVNTVSLGLQVTGLLSPNPTTGPIATR